MPRKVQPALRGVFVPCGGFFEDWGIFGGFYLGFFRKIPQRKAFIFKRFGRFWGIGEIII